MFTKSSVSQALIDATKAIMEASDKKLLLEPSKKMPERLQADISKKKDDKAAATGNTAEVREAMEKKTDFMDRQKRLAAASAETQKDPARLKRMSSIPGYTAAMDLAKKTTTKEEIGEAKEEKHSDNPNSPFNYKGQPSTLFNKPGSKAGFDSKKISTGTVYTKKYGKDKEEMKEEHEDAKEDEMQDKKILKSMVKKSALKDDESKESKKDNEKKEMSEERHMTGGEKEKREKIVKSMKKGLSGFKARYGDRAKNVMYATATKQAMKEEIESLDEGKMDKMSLSSLWHQHAHHSYGEDQGYGGGDGGKHSKHAATAIENHVRKHHGNKCADDMCDHSEHYVAADEYVGSQKERNEVEASAAKLRKKHGIEGNLHGMHESVNEALKGKQYKLDKNHNGKIDKQDFEILRKEDIGGISTISEKKKGMKEVKEAEEAEYVRMEPNEDMKSKTVDTLAGRKKVGADYHNQSKSYKLKLNVEGKGTDVDPNFVTNESTPMKMAKEMAKKSFKKIRTETLGMAGATSEEKKKW